MEEYRRQILALISRRVPNPEDVQDLSQEIWIQVWKALPGFVPYKGMGGFYQWLKTIAEHRVAQHFRDKSREPQTCTFEDQKEPPSDKGQPDPEAVERRRVLHQFLMQQLYEILVQREDQDKDLGRLKVYAFVSYYEAQYAPEEQYRTLDETVKAVQAQARSIHYGGEITPQMVKNWVQQGRILKQLARHLVSEHWDYIQSQARPLIPGLDLPEVAKRVLGEWVQGKTIEELVPEDPSLQETRTVSEDPQAPAPPVAEGSLSLTIKEARAVLKDAQSALSDCLFNLIKRQLHDLRHGHFP
jgi:RNA polymerase sigma factor (sigma-70 family)